MRQGKNGDIDIKRQGRNGDIDIKRQSRRGEERGRGRKGGEVEREHRDCEIGRHRDEQRHQDTEKGTGWRGGRKGWRATEKTQQERERESERERHIKGSAKHARCMFDMIFICSKKSKPCWVRLRVGEAGPTIDCVDGYELPAPIPRRVHHSAKAAADATVAEQLNIRVPIVHKHTS